MRASNSIITSILLYIFSITFCHAQIAVQSGMTADAHCGRRYCVTAVYVPQQRMINYTLVAEQRSGSPVGWIGFAQGTGMRGANMALNWRNPDGSLTTSHRSAVGEVYPTPELAQSLPALTVNNGIVPSSDSQIVWSWSFAQDSAPSNRMEHIMASSSQAAPSSSPNANLAMHDHYEYPIRLDMTKPYSGGAPAGLAGSTTTVTGTSSSEDNEDGEHSGSSSSSEGMRNLSDIRTRLYLVHMIFMTIAWLLFVPLGIFIARYGRTFFTWFPHHRNIQVFSTLLIVIGAALGIAAVARSGKMHLSSDHAKAGVSLLVLLGVQILLGIFAHWFRGRTGKRYIGFIHMPLGIALMAIAVYTMHLGFDQWNWDPPKGAKIFVYVWAGFLLLVYLIGLALLPKEIRQSRQAQAPKKEEASA